jgi:phenylalanyl-tRNA synthetase alpha chain
VNLPPHHYALISALAQADSSTPPRIEQLAAASGVDQAQLTAAAVELEREGILSIGEEDYIELKLTEAGSEIASGAATLPERQIAGALHDMGGSGTIKELMDQPRIQSSHMEPGKYARGLSELGWADFDRGTLRLRGNAADPGQSALEFLLQLAAAEVGGVLEVTGADYSEGIAQLRSRKDYAGLKDRTRRLVMLTEPGERLLTAFKAGDIHELREVNELTPEMLADGSWRDASFRTYDVTLAAEVAVPGKAHPMSRLIEEVRRAFLALGFEEANCPMAESAFWDFDALFQPQDHPAREMQDTLYCSNPATFPLPDPALVEAVRATHETGGTTGSLGWRYTWDEQRASQVVLRTHMTASSILALARDPHPPRKVFSIGRVFRRETMDSTHLPEFTQVDGIIIDTHANLASLLGTLATFYSRMGIDDIKMKPAFFPYTEPSVEVHIKWAGKWMEMGGAGIFRPEVTEPFGCKVPVLAWGLGLERLAMARFGLGSIKDLYQPRLDWLRNVPVNS